MSGRDDRSRGYDRDRGGDRRGYDRRERSPRGYGSGRGSYRDERGPVRSEGYRQYEDSPRRGSSRGSYEWHHGSTTSGRGDSSFGTRGPSSRTDTTLSSERLPELPETVEIPTDKGRAYAGVPLREPRGKMGRPLKVMVNHFAIESLPIIKVYQYEVRMRVPASSQRRGSDKVSSFMQAKVFLNSQDLWGKFFVFDGATGWSPENLIPDSNEEKHAIVNLPGHTNEKPNQVEVAMRNVGHIKVSKMVDFIAKGNVGLACKDVAVEDCFKALNCLFRDDPSQRFLTVDKSSAYFIRTPGLVHRLESTGGVLEAIRGVYQSVSNAFGRPSLTIDTKTIAMFVPHQSLLDNATKISGVSDPARIDRSACEEALVGTYFVVRHLSEQKNAVKKRVQKLSTSNALDTVFEVYDAGTNQKYTTSVFDYFLKKYQIRLKHPELPLLITKDGAFPMEVCFTTEGVKYREPLSGPATADFIRFATSPARIRYDQIMQNVQRLAHHTLPKLKGWGIAVSPKMSEVPALLLPAPNPLYATGEERAAASGSWNLRNKRFVKPAGFRSWGCCYFSNPQRPLSETEIERFSRALDQSLTGHGLRTAGGPPAVIKANPQGDVHAIVGDLINKTRQVYDGRGADLLIFLLHQNTPTALYRAIKSACEADFAVPSQVVIIEKAFKDKGQPQYLSNVAMKINVKLSGTNWTIADPLYGKESVMLVGADATHPSPGELRRPMPPPSYSALCASMDSQCSMYSAVCVSQPSTQELIDSETFAEMFKVLLERYKTRNGKTPTVILFFRDGISDHQIRQWLDTEVQAIKKVRTEMRLNFKLTSIPAVKRHHTRIFPTSSNEGDRLGNVRPGTVVANGMLKNDIYVVSQSALQGTCRPTHYFSVEDENSFSIDEFSRLVLAGCFSYQKATRSVSLHAAVFYADQCCERAKMHLREEGGRLLLKDVKPELAMYWQ